MEKEQKDDGKETDAYYREQVESLKAIIKASEEVLNNSKKALENMRKFLDSLTKKEK
jgi:hypothetical protein